MIDFCVAWRKKRKIRKLNKPKPFTPWLWLREEGVASHRETTAHFHHETDHIIC